ncbi:protein PAL OF QUIRKY-like [Phragmites australis]|uniref:protein PAL OF QUIRKY-like n=1 Tax=Phragmites australis TaxID=29695 RepID=UPI002D785FB1|nr:protein PAL OF QUIRKY-like [Phragmites australis]
MPNTSPPSSTSSSCVSFGSFEEVSAAKQPGPTLTNGVKFLCSYGGKILPRRHDGQLRYVGGHTRVLSVQHPLRFYDLHRKLRELCGWDAVSVRCQLPTEDLDALISVTSDDDLANLLQEYDLAAASQERPQQLRIRAFLLPPAGTRTPRTPSSPPLASRRRPGHLLMHATRAGSPRAVRFIV